MPYPLNNVATSDQYTDAATCNRPTVSTKATIVITNAAVFVQLENCEGSLTPGSGQYMPEEFWIPAAYGITRDFPIGNIRFRSAASGTPGRVNAV